MWLHWGKKVPLLWLWLRIWSFFEGEKKKKKRERENGANSKRATTSSVQTPGGPDRRAGVSSTLRGEKKEKQLSPALFLKRTCSTNRSVFLFHKAHCYSLPSLSFFPPGWISRCMFINPGEEWKEERRARSVSISLPVITYHR